MDEGRGEEKEEATVQHGASVFYDLTAYPLPTLAIEHRPRGIMGLHTQERGGPVHLFVFKCLYIPSRREYSR